MKWLTKGKELLEKTFSKKEKETLPEQQPKEITQKIIIEEKAVKFTTKSIIKFWLFWLIFVFLGYLFFSTLDMIYLIITAFIIAISMEGIITWLEKRVKSRGLAIAIGYFLLIIFLVSWIVLIIPFIISQVSQLLIWISSSIFSIREFVTTSTWPDAISQINWLPEFAKWYILENRDNFNFTQESFQATLTSSLNSLFDASVTYLKQVSSWVFTFIGNLFTILWELWIVFTLAIFFSIEKKYSTFLIAKCFSGAKKSAVYNKINRIYSQLSIWLKARLILSLCLTLMLWIVLFILKLCWVYIPSIFSLSLIAWLLDIIPYIGPLIAWVPIAILAWIHNWIRWFFIIWTLFVVIQWIQENVITPILMWKQLGVNSLLILICALLWAIVMWFWWIVLSVPLAVVIGLFIDDENKWEDE